MSTAIPFCKMHGLGNDFIVIAALDKPVDIQKLPIATLAERHIGIGFDQLILIQPSKIADFACRFFNADGSEAEQCGNGLRCIARYLHEEELTTKTSLSLETKSGVVKTEIKNYDSIRVQMGIPKFNKEIVSLNMGTHLVELSVLSMGNPHAILYVPSVRTAKVAEWGPAISKHAIFPEGTNVGFMEILSRDRIRLRTYERGVGETCACGSNACAAVASGIQNQLLDKQVNVMLPYGSLTIEWEGNQNPLMMTGPASRVFSGVI